MVSHARHTTKCTPPTLGSVPKPPPHPNIQLHALKEGIIDTSPAM